MNVLSLFDGISCGMVALERANIKVDNYYASEIDENAITISQSNYPNIHRLGDVRSITKEVIESLPKIDLLLGGSPCQGFSKNGNNLNFEHPQSKLFFNFVEILELIRQHNNPNVLFLLENVDMKDAWKDVITQYVGVLPIKINSKLLSAQNRPRIYWTNINGVVAPKDANISLKDILEDVVDLNTKQYKGILVEDTLTPKELSLIDVVEGEVRIKQPTKKGYIVANDGDSINLAYPSSTTRRGRVIKQKSSTLDKACYIYVYSDGVLRKLRMSELEKLQTLPVGYTSSVSPTNGKIGLGNGWTVDIIAHILKNIRDY